MRKVMIIALLIVFVGPLGFAFAVKRVPAATIGVRKIKWGGGGI